MSKKPTPGESEPKRIPAQAKREAKEAESDSRGDDRATAEAKQLSSGLSEDKLKKIAEENEAKRTERFRDHFERLAIFTLYVVYLSLLLVGLVWLFHIITPTCWHFLTPAQAEKVQAIITGGIIAGIAAGHLKKRLSG